VRGDDRGEDAKRVGEDVGHRDAHGPRRDPLVRGEHLEIDAIAPRIVARGLERPRIVVDADGGARAAVGVDVRVVAATHRDLRDDAAGFRRDLFYRLAGIVIAVPPLRDRRDDILPLADHFLARAAVAAGHPPPALGASARAWLLAQPWPGNVRELRNAIERAVLLCDGGVVEIPHLAGEPAATAPGDGSLRDTLAGVERARIRAVLDDCRWNQSEAARRLGMARNTLAAKIRAYDLRR
jgi:DNA-binding NtrC family response regulator